MAFTNLSRDGQQAELDRMRAERDDMVAKGLTAAAALQDRSIANREQRAK